MTKGAHNLCSSLLLLYYCVGTLFSNGLGLEALSVNERGEKILNIAHLAGYTQ